MGHRRSPLLREPGRAHLARSRLHRRLGLQGQELLVRLELRSLMVHIAKLFIFAVVVKGLRVRQAPFTTSEFPPQSGSMARQETTSFFALKLFGLA